MILYTGKGDGGTTKLLTTKKGVRLNKTNPVFEALGTLDELNTILGWCRCACGVDWVVGDTVLSSILFDAQQVLFTIQAELAGADKSVSKEKIEEVEKILENIEGKIPKITSFLVPGSGGELSARLDMARAVGRRTERTVIAAHEGSTPLTEYTLAYMNRLSSLLYALVRFVNYQTDTDEQSPKYIG